MQIAPAVAAIDSRIDPQTRTLSVHALIPNPDHLLMPGMTFSITVPIEGDLMPIVPALAVQWGREGASVWRVGDGRIERVPVVIRKRDGDDVYVEAEDGVSGADLSRELYGAPETERTLSATLSSLYVQVLRPLCWTGLLHEQRIDGISAVESVFAKTPLWRAALQLNTDDLVKPAVRH